MFPHQNQGCWFVPSLHKKFNSSGILTLSSLCRTKKGSPGVIYWVKEHCAIKYILNAVLFEYTYKES